LRGKHKNFDRKIYIQLYATTGSNPFYIKKTIFELYIRTPNIYICPMLLKITIFDFNLYSLLMVWDPHVLDWTIYASTTKIKTIS